jgi:hypothetical protein
MQRARSNVLSVPKCESGTGGKNFRVSKRETAKGVEDQSHLPLVSCASCMKAKSWAATRKKSTVSVCSLICTSREKLHIHFSLVDVRRIEATG